MLENPEDPIERTRKALDHFLTTLAEEVVDEFATEGPFTPPKSRPTKSKPSVGDSVPVSKADE